MSHRVIDDALSEARVLLHDTEVTEQRYTDAALVNALNSALDNLYSIRPDAFIDLYATGVPHYTVSDLASAVAWPVHDIFFTPCVMFIAGWAELADLEDTRTDRAAALLAGLKTLVLTGG